MSHQSKRTVFLLSQNSFRVSGQTQEMVIEKLNVDISLIIGGCNTLPLVTGSIVQFSCVIDFCLAELRKRRLLKNDRTLLRSLDSLAVISSLAVAKKHKEVYDDDCFNVSDVLEVMNSIAKSEGLENPSEISKEVVDAEKSSNMVSPWDLLKESSWGQEENFFSTTMSDHQNVLIIFDPQWFEDKGTTPHLDLFKKFLPAEEFNFKQVIVGTSLDASFVEDADVTFELTDVERLEDLATCAPVDFDLKSRSFQHCSQIVESYLRLLVNSRDELSLANVICGPAGFLCQSDFNLIKHEARSTKMPLFQTLISFANKARIGGQTLENLRSHPFAPFQKEIVDFANLIDKLQLKIEDSKTESAALTGLSSVLRSHLSSKLNASVVSEVTCSCNDLYERLWNRSQARSQPDSTPKRSVSSGGSLVGMKNLKAVRLLVDFYSALPLRNSSPNYHLLLGKIEDAGTSPAVLPNILSMFKSPSSDSEVDIIESSIQEPKEVIRKKPGRPKYEAMLSWANESSPIVVPSPDLNAKRPEGESPASSRPRNPEENFLTKGREVANQALREARQDRKKRQLPKRSILSEINNLAKRPIAKSSLFTQKVPCITAVDTANEPPSKKVAIEVTKKENSTKLKKVTGKKIVPQIKGQAKITAFMRM